MYPFYTCGDEIGVEENGRNAPFFSNAFETALEFFDVDDDDVLSFALSVSLSLSLSLCLSLEK